MLHVKCKYLTRKKHRLLILFQALDIPERFKLGGWGGLIGRVGGKTRRWGLGGGFLVRFSFSLGKGVGRASEKE